MGIQNIIVYILVAGAVVLLLLKFLKPALSNKKKNNPEKTWADVEKDCNVK